MKGSDIVRMVIFSSFGLWWAVALKSVIRFHTWFHHGQLSRIPGPVTVRVVGILWVVLVACVAVFGVRR